MDTKNSEKLIPERLLLGVVGIGLVPATQKFDPAVADFVPREMRHDCRFLATNTTEGNRAEPCKRRERSASRQPRETKDYFPRLFSALCIGALGMGMRPSKG